MEVITSRSRYPVSEVGPSVQQRPKRWKLHKANWEQFRIHCEQIIHPNAFEDTSLLYSAAENLIPRTSTSPKHPNKPWFNDDCKKAIAEQFNLRPTQENIKRLKLLVLKLAELSSKVNVRLRDSKYLD